MLRCDCGFLVGVDHKALPGFDLVIGLGLGNTAPALFHIEKTIVVRAEELFHFHTPVAAIINIQCNIQVGAVTDVDAQVLHFACLLAGSIFCLI